MKPYRLNALMAGLLYFAGTAFGVTGAFVGGEAIASLVVTDPLPPEKLMQVVAANPAQLVHGAFFTLLMGISLAAMTVFLYPLFRRDSEELALGMLLFRGALEGTWYFVSCLSLLMFSALGTEYLVEGADRAGLLSLASILYRYQDLEGPTGTILFLVGATCLYVSFYRTRLIPRWLSVWGLVGGVLYLAYALLHLFGMDNGIGFYLQMVLAPQEMVMALWLVFMGFDADAVTRLMRPDPGLHGQAAGHELRR